MLILRKSDEGIPYYVSPLLESAGVMHAFSTRIGGVSRPPFDSLNLGNPSDTEIKDDWSNIYENYARLQAAIGGADRNRCWVHQVHGGDVARCDEAFESGCKADAMTTNDPGRLLSVRVADCVPILIAAADGRQVAAVHAGWRGVLAGGVLNAINQLGVDPTELVAAIGPCIGFDHFEVGGEVLAAFLTAFGESAPLARTDGGKGRVDLRRSIELQLLGVGVQRIDRTDRCTFTHGDEFFSHRRDRGVTGRMAAMIGPRA